MEGPQGQSKVREVTEFREWSAILEKSTGGIKYVRRVLARLDCRGYASAIATRRRYGPAQNS